MPPEIGSRIDFYPLTSMDYFLRHDLAKGAFDFAFIDGDHSYQAAFFDLCQTGARIRPGGVIVLDNSEIWGVAYAVADFLERNPAWRLAGHAPGDVGNLREIGHKRKGKGPLGLLVLLAPSSACLGKFPLEGAITGLNAGPYGRMRLEFGREAAAGVVEFSLFFVAWDRNFHETGHIAAQTYRSGKAEVATGAAVVEIPFDPVLLDASLQESNIELQYVFRFLAADEVSGLALAAVPLLL